MRAYGAAHATGGAGTATGSGWVPRRAGAGEPELEHHAAFHDDPIAKLNGEAREESVEHHQLTLPSERPPREGRVGPEAGLQRLLEPKPERRTFVPSRRLGRRHDHAGR